MPRKKFNLREEREAVRGARPWNDAILNPVILTREEAELEAARSRRGRKRQRACASGGAAEQSKRMRVRAETSGDGAGDGASPATRDDGQAGGSELDGRKSIPDVGRAPKSTSPPVLPVASSSSVSADKNKTLLKVLALQKAQRAASATGSSEGGRRRRRLKRAVPLFDQRVRWVRGHVPRCLAPGGQGLEPLAADASRALLRGVGDLFHGSARRGRRPALAPRRPAPLTIVPALRSAPPQLALVSGRLLGPSRPLFNVASGLVRTNSLMQTLTRGKRATEMRFILSSHNFAKRA